MNTIGLRFVVLRHEGVPEPHFDLMFETAPGSLLATWRAAEWPLRNGTPLERLPDHRRAYLDYEGPVSQNRGHVKRVAAGNHSLIESNTLADFCVILVTGERYRLPQQGSGAAIRL